MSRLKGVRIKSLDKMAELSHLPPGRVIAPFSEVIGWQVR
jgi:hypothetical protein